MNNRPSVHSSKSGQTELSFRDLLRELNASIHEEIQSVKDQGGSFTVAVTNGRLVSTSHDKYTYTFEITTAALPNVEDSAARLIVDGKSYDVVITRFADYQMEIDAAVDLGPLISKAKVSIDFSWLLERLATRLSEIEDGKMKFNKEAAWRVLVPGAQSTASASDSQYKGCNFTRTKDGYEPREDQLRAIQHGMSRCVSFIWGPPGTGKTTTIAWLIEALLRAGKRVLVVSHLNVAVDKAISAAVTLLHSNSEVANRQLIRFPKFRYERDMAIDLLQCADYEEISKHKSREIQEQLCSLQTTLEATAQKVKTVEGYIDMHVTLERVRRDLSAVFEQLKSKRNDLYLIDKTIVGINDELTEVTRRYALATSSSGLKRFFLGLNPSKLFAERERLEASIREQQSLRRLAEDSLKAVLSMKATLEAEMDATSKSLAQPTEEWPPHIKGSLSKLKEIKSELDSRATSLQSQISELNRRLDSIKREILLSAKVIGATLSKSFLDVDLYGQSFDAVVLDEASIAPLPAVFFVSGLTSDKCIIVGDFRQLGPICISEQTAKPGERELAQKWFGRCIFEQAEICDSNLRLKPKQHVCQLLEVQNRMPVPISKIVSKFIYDDIMIRDGQNIKPLEPDKARSQVALYDTSIWNPWCTRAYNYTHFNVRQGLFTLKLAKDMVLGRRREALPAPSERRTLDRRDIVLILTPYKGQAELIQHICDLDEELKKHVRVSSIYQIQGEEYNRVIVDLVDGNPLRSPGILFTKNKGLRLINVALSRSKGTVTIVGNLNFFRKYPALRVTGILDYVAKNHDYSQVTDTSSGIDPQMIWLTQPITFDYDLKGVTFLTEQDFYGSFMKDLRDSAHKEIIVSSPFITLQRVSTLREVFAEKVRAGVQIGVLTRSHRRQAELEFDDIETAIKGLEEVGVKMISRYTPALHEKIAIIDGRITYHGSLNILSHSGKTSESMLRFDDIDFAQKMMALHKLKDLFEQAAADDRAKIIFARLLLKKPKCPACGHDLTIKRGRKDRWPYYFCGTRERHGSKSVNGNDIVAVLDEKDKVCPKGHQIICKTIQKGRQLLCCNGYPDHKFVLRF